MDLIVAVYADWGIGRNGTQPVTLKADRKFFRETTRGYTVIAGRRTVEDFPGKKPLPGRENILLTRHGGEYPGFTRCGSVEEVLEKTKNTPRTMVIGGGSIYRQLLPYCDRAYVTFLRVKPDSDTWFPNLDEMADWSLSKILDAGEEDGIQYEFRVYDRRKQEAANS